ncbi:Type III restriction-modification system methylation subunit (EC, partial [uncultured Gammaproteobacteria bacterium]
NFAGKVKLIYIDPPYNTGNDSFNYNDNFNHSTWLTFMKNRLEIARDLLSEDGVIFVQCDDNEQAYLKVLMDEVFERDNFVANFIWKKKGTSTNVKGVQVSQLCELIVCYTATKATAIYSRIIKSENRTYSHKDELGKYRLVIIEKKNTGEYRRESMRFKIIGKEPRTGKRWQIGEIKAKKLETAGRFILDNEIVKQKIYDFEDADSFSAQPTLLDNIGSTNEGDREITKLSFGGKFNNPKPEKLLQRIIHIATKKGDLVLDYHLGSGTTCAVAHKMGRQYIGIEQMDYIEDIAVKRMQKVI